jgi:hypothetical protein
MSTTSRIPACPCTVSWGAQRVNALSSSDLVKFNDQMGEWRLGTGTVAFLKLPVLMGQVHQEVLIG